MLKEVPANCTAVGVPGRIVKQDGAKIPRMDMNQVDLPTRSAMTIKELQVDNLRMHKAYGTGKSVKNGCACPVWQKKRRSNKNEDL